MGKPQWYRKRTTSLEDIEIRRTKLFYPQLSDHLTQPQNIQPPDSWETLSREILVLVFSYLSMNDIENVRSVCKAWNVICGSEYLWRVLHLTHFGGPRFDGRSWKFHCLFANNELETIKRQGYLKAPTFNEPGIPDSLCRVVYEDGTFGKLHKWVFELWMWAADRGHYKVLENIWNLRLIPNLEVRDTFTRRTALFRTVQGGHVECLKWLLSVGASPEARSEELSTPLFSAAGHGNLDIVRVLIEANVDINGAGRAGGTPLMMACQHRRLDVIVDLLKNPKCDINQPLRDGETSLFVAAMLGFTDVVEILLWFKADVNKARYSGSTPFWVACKHGQLAVVKQLAQVKEVNQSVFVQGISCLEIALRKGHLNVANFLIKNLKTDVSNLPPTQILLEAINRNLT